MQPPPKYSRSAPSGVYSECLLSLGEVLTMISMMTVDPSVVVVVVVVVFY